MKRTKKKKNIAISVKNISKVYTIRHEKPTLAESLIYRANKEKYLALEDISFQVNVGERLGIVGSNGSGKTTLLKLLAGITKEQSGQILVKGKVVSLIDLSAGFHSDLTGEENIFLNGLVIGMTKKQIEEKKSEIIEFADIGKFIDAPLYTYSSGMVLRLGFSIAIHSNPDVFLLDEGFAVGDGFFREKAKKKMDEFKKQGKTLVMVSHWLDEIKKNCNKILWIEKGRVVSFGGRKVLIEYENFAK